MNFMPFVKVMYIYILPTNQSTNQPTNNQSTSFTRQNPTINPPIQQFNNQQTK